jgi:hypothetical protein
MSKGVTPIQLLLYNNLHFLLENGRLKLGYCFIYYLNIYYCFFFKLFNINMSQNMVSHILLKIININFKIYINLIMEIIKILNKIITNKYNYVTRS